MPPASPNKTTEKTDDTPTMLEVLVLKGENAV